MNEYTYEILAYTDYGEGHIIEGVINAEDMAAAIIASRSDAQEQIQDHLRLIKILNIRESTETLDPIIIDGFKFNKLEVEHGKTQS